MTDWAKLHAPTLADFEVLAEEAYARLPEEFRAGLDRYFNRLEQATTSH